MANGTLRSLASLALAGTLGLSACSEPPPRAEGDYPITLAELGVAPTPRDQGEAAYLRTCIACHGADGKGNGGKTGADFSSPTGALTKPDDQLLAAVRDGKQGSIGVMPPHRALLTDAELTAVVAYVRKSYGAGIVVGPTVAPTIVDARVPALAAEAPSKNTSALRQ